MSNTCIFDEPWIGVCGKPVASGSIYCCDKHAAEKCQVCGGQAFTRCMASIGVMCGVPLCKHCGGGEMCLHHSQPHEVFVGPLVVINRQREKIAVYARDVLLKLMEEISEDHWAAGWMDGLEFQLWAIVKGDRVGNYGMGDVSEDEIKRLAELSKDAMGWFYYRWDEVNRINSGPVFVYSLDWWSMYDKHRAARTKDTAPMD